MHYTLLMNVWGHPCDITSPSSVQSAAVMLLSNPPAYPHKCNTELTEQVVSLFQLIQLFY